MAASVSGGYDYKFVDEKKVSKYTCPVCTLVLRDPQQTACGHLICESCLQQLKDKGNNFTCPTCRADLTGNFFPDQRVNRAIKCLQVYCNNKDDGCQCKGDLKDIEDHLQKCPYQLVSCSNDCGKNLQRRHLKNHLKNDCPKRLIKCQYCNKRGRHQVITGDHLGVCPEYPARCTNEGCGQLMPRYQMPSHKALCPKEMISCGYRSVGCEEMMKREEQEEHNEQWRERHLQLAIGEVNELNSAIDELNSDVADLQEEQSVLLSKLHNLEIKTQCGYHPAIEYKPSNIVKFENFAENKSDDTPWFSPGFYTSPGGYKMRLCVDANGEGTHVSCYIQLMSGEYDDILEWPFHGEVTIQLLNQLEDENHHKMVVNFDGSTPQHSKSQVIGGERAENSWGIPQFISHSQLDDNLSLMINCQYLKNDTLHFRVSVKVTSNTKPWLVA